MKDVEQIFNEALKLVKECSNILKDVDFDKEAVIKSDGSLVTKYDLMLDEKLTKGLKAIVDYPVLSEEHKEVLGDSYFVIDPIDGTHNFSRGFECFGIMLGLVVKGTIMFGIVDLPLLNKTYTAIRGKGAYLNGNKITVREPGERFIGNTNMRSQTVLDWIAALRRSDHNFEFRSLYCTCVPYCYIASGNFDFAIQHGKMGIWDSLAPKIIIEEAGGICEVIQHEEARFSVIAGSKEVYKIIKENIGEMIPE